MGNSVEQQSLLLNERKSNSGSDGRKVGLDKHNANKA